MELHKMLVDKCAIGKKQEDALSDAQKKFTALRKKKSACCSAPAMSNKANKQSRELEKQNLQLQIDAAKDKTKTREKLAKDHKKEADDTKKELSQVNNDLGKEKDKVANIGHHLDKALIEVKESAESKRAWNKS